MKVKKGKSHISFRGRGSITVKAKTKEEAEQKFKERFEEMLNESTLYTFADNKLDKRWSGLLGVEKPKRGRVEKKSFFEELYWKNSVNGETKHPEDRKHMKNKEEPEDGEEE